MKTKQAKPEEKIVVLIHKEIPQERRDKLELIVDKSRWSLLRISPFYGCLLMGLKDTFSYYIPTAATNGRNIIWNPDFLESLTDQEVRFVLIHEVKHVALGHLWRFPKLPNGKFDKKANIACDHAINLTLLDAIDVDGSKLDISMPKGGLADPKFKGLAEEEIYRRLPDDPDNNGNDNYGDGEGDVCGSFTEPDDEDNGEPEDGRGVSDSLREEWERRLINAAEIHRKHLKKGDIPADIERIIQERLAQKVDWRQEMADFLKTIITERNDWTRSPSRHAWERVVYPRKKRDAVSRVVFVRDCSGSVGDEILAAFNCLIEQCISEMGCAGLVLDCDAKVNAQYEIGPGIPVSRTAKGGGGTSFIPPFKLVKELIEDGDEISGLIYLTDLMGDFPDSKHDAFPNFPVLWLSVEKGSQAPFGRTVFIEI